MAKTNKSMMERIKDTGFVAELWQQVRLVFYLIKDRDVPLYLKLLPLLAVAYTLFPLDIITDFIPGLGQLDDLMILTIGAKIFIEMVPAEIVARYTELMRAEKSATIIEGETADKTEE
jgi:uncharacterized membrane protein YkvA (DUF1232 family)